MKGDAMAQPRSAREIAEYLEQQIVSGELRPSEPLPSVRVLAKKLSVSVTTVTAAFKALQVRGLTYPERGVGTLVRPQETVALSPSAPLAEGLVDVASGNPDPDLLPDLNQFLHTLEVPRQMYRMQPILPELADLTRQTLSDVEGGSRASYSIASGALDAIDLVLTARLRAGDRVIVEDPGFAASASLLRSFGLELIPVPVDEEGFLPDAFAEALAQHARAVLYSPRAQNPTGCALSPERAAALRALLGPDSNVLVIENDHASMVSGVPYHSLTPAAREWAVVRSASKSHGPDLRFSFLAGDVLTVSRVEKRQMLGRGWLSVITQSLVLALYRDGSVRELVTSADRLYTYRRELLIERLREQGVAALGRSGLNVCVPVRHETEVLRAMDARGWSVQSGEGYRIAAPPFVRLTMTALSDEQIDRLAADVGAAVHDSPPLTRTG